MVQRLYGVGCPPEASDSVSFPGAVYVPASSIEAMLRELDSLTEREAAICLLSIEVMPAMHQRQVWHGLRARVPVVLVGGEASPEIQAQGHAWVPSLQFPALSEQIALAQQRWAIQRSDLLWDQVFAVGQLAGGVAHDFNNALTVLVGNLELIEMSVGDDGVRQLTSTAIKAAESGMDMTRRLGQFSNRGSEQSDHDANAIVQAIAGEFSGRIGGGVTLKTQLEAEPLEVRVNRQRIENALRNILQNAIDATEGSGSIVIETGLNSLTAGQSAMRVFGTAIPDRYMVISVVDDGLGMDANTLAQSADLFFGTKWRRRDGGIGLSVARAYLDGEGGTLAIESTPGVGTRVHCVLPLPLEVASQSGAASKSADDAAPKRVLLVEDNARVAEATQQMLITLGHSVQTVTSGLAALREVSRSQDFDVVLSDIDMPGEVDGIKLSRAIREAFTGVAVLLFSGSRDGVEADLPAGQPLLQKPFTMESLNSAIEAALAVVRAN